MEIAVSHIAWPQKNEDSFLELLVDNGIRLLEVAPYKLNSSWNITSKEVERYLLHLEKYGISVYSMQGILYQVQSNIFTHPQAILNHFIDNVLPLARDLNVQKIVFGAPALRKLPGNCTVEMCNNIAIELFQKLSTQVDNIAPNTCICIEPNAKVYGCEYVTNSKEGIDFVVAVNRKNIKLHLDTANMSLEGETGDTLLNKHVEHLHISQPYLTNFNSPVVDHYGYASYVKEKNLPCISIEKSSTGVISLDKVELIEAINFCKNTYL